MTCYQMSKIKEFKTSICFKNTIFIPTFLVNYTFFYNYN